MKQYDFEKKFIRVIERNSLSMLIIYCCHYSDLALKHARWWSHCLVSHGFLDFFYHYTKLSPTFLPFSTLLRWDLNKSQSIPNFSHLFTYLNAQSTLLPKKDSLIFVRWFYLLNITYPTADNLYWFTRYTTCSNSFFRHFYRGFISNDYTFITFVIRITKGVILI